MMKKKIVTPILIGVFLLLAIINNIVFATDNIVVKLNGDTLNFDVPPQIIDGRTMVPMRTIFESIGATVEWNQTTKTVKSQKQNTVVSLTIGVSEISVNGNIKKLDIAPCIINDRTLVPVRAVSEAFDLDVEWDSNSRTVNITSDNHSNSGYSIPYCSRESSKIGKKFSENYVPGDGLQYSSSSMYILMVQQYPLRRGFDWDAYMDYNDYASKIGVSNDKIVFNIQDMPNNTVLSEAIPDVMRNVKPLISYGYDDNGKVKEQMLFWKGKNGYIVAFVEAKGYPNGSYLNEKVKYFIDTVDLNYINTVPEEVKLSNPKF